MVQDNNTSEIINKKYMEDIKFYLMNKSKEYKKDINEFISNLTEKIEIENKSVNNRKFLFRIKKNRICCIRYSNHRVVNN